LLIGEKQFTGADLVRYDGLWFSFSYNTEFARQDREACLDLVNHTLMEGAAWLRNCSHLLITLGTAWTYEYLETGRVVANCHKLPAARFARKLLGVDEICTQWNTALEALTSINPAIRVIFTVSPVRHWKDGAINNQVSKAILLLSIHQLVSAHENCGYFPAYEIFMDELRDYRFYAADMLHPSETGSEYVWDRFGDTYFSGETKQTMAEVAAIIKAVAHRPRQTESDKLREFTENTLQQIDTLTSLHPHLDFTRETILLRDRLNPPT
jgi:hypothetical protein